MRKGILIAVGVIAIAVVGIVAFIAVQPAEFQIVRSTDVQASPEVVFDHVNDFHNWDAWSPWMKLDPNAKSTFSGPDSGEGAKFGWSGNDEIGEGDMTILESKPSELVKIDLHFVRPFEDRSVTEFTFKPKEEGTTINWKMSGRKNFMSKAVCLFMDMDKMVGGDFEKGLANMKAIVEAKADPKPDDETKPPDDAPSTTDKAE